MTKDKLGDKFSKKLEEMGAKVVDVTQPTPTQAPYIRAEGICTEKDYTPTQPQAEEWEHKLEEHFVHFHFAHDNNVEQDKNTLEFREFMRDFITSLLAKEREDTDYSVHLLLEWIDGEKALWANDTATTINETLDIVERKIRQIFTPELKEE